MDFNTLLSEMHKEYVKDYEKDFLQFIGSGQFPSELTRQEFINKWSPLIQNHGVPKRAIQLDTIFGQAYFVYLKVKNNSSSPYHQPSPWK